MIRAILLASATATNIGGFRSSICASHGFLFAPRRRACRITAVLSAQSQFSQHQE
jgi:hypothetical protein